MRFIRDDSSSILLIRGYQPGEIQLEQQRLRDALILNATTFSTDPTLRTVEDLGEREVSRLLQLEPQVVLIGSGARQAFPAAWFTARFLSAGIGLEVMDTGAACRTFNVLVSEQRGVAALLLP